MPHYVQQNYPGYINIRDHGLESPNIVHFLIIDLLNHICRRNAGLHCSIFT